MTEKRIVVVNSISKTNILRIISSLILLLITIFIVVFSRMGTGVLSVDNNQTFAPAETVDVKVGDTPIAEYTICYDAGMKKAAQKLERLIENESGCNIKLTPFKPSDKYIYVHRDRSKSGYNIENGNITISANDLESASHQINVFSNTYLGYAFTGETREHLIENTTYANVPADVSVKSDVWMENREPIICLWKTNTSRGIYADQNVSLKSELMSYSDDQLYQYVKMMKHIGFTGIQVTDMCSAWAQYGNYEFVQQRLRFMADAAHSLDMKFTLWVWGAEFDGYGWVDKSIKYIDYDHLSQEDEDCIATFEKYYSIYAKLADCSDRVIMHFNDPGNLYSSKDIGYFAEEFRKKCVAVNPSIDFGVSCYRFDNDINEIKEYLPKGSMIYTGIAHTEDEVERYRNYSNWIAVNEYRRGIWSWNLAEMEIDQMAEMNVNAKLIAKAYQYTIEAGELVAPEYWSEMDSYHVLNVFSLYCSGNLLQDPYDDPDKLLHEVSEKIVGKEDSDTLYECLSIIQDARSGDSWDSFQIKDHDGYIILSKDYPAEDLIKRCDADIPKMEELANKDLQCNTIALPSRTSELIELIIPHLQQIREYAQFRVSLTEAEKMYSDGKSEEEIQRFVNKMYSPVHEYNTVTGCWGQIEARAQSILMEQFCEKVGIDIPRNASFDEYRKRRIYGEMLAKQETTDVCQKFNVKSGYQFGVAFGEKDTERLINELVDDGLLCLDSDGNVYINDWQRENIKYSFY